jgi:bile acid:Na+ symporter, BASS family
MDSALTTVGLPIALALVMFGLGLGLTSDDFRRVAKHPKAVAVALACQLVLLPLVCFGLVVLADLPALLGIGMMLLAASPGGTTANLFSHLFRGDVALNITLTAVNSVISVVTLPIVTGIAIAYYDRGDSVSVPFTEVVKVFAIVLVPVVIGMLVRNRKPGFAARMDRPVRIGSAVVLAILVLGILVDERDNVGGYLADVGLVAAAFCAISLVVGYVVPRAVGVVEGQAIACSMEIGVHNGTLAIFMAVEVLEAVTISVPAAVYSLVMFPLAALWGTLISRRVRRPVAV